MCSYLHIVISWLVSFGVCIYTQYFFDVVRSKLQTISIYWVKNKRRLKVQERNMSYERALNFDQWKIFSENYKPLKSDYCFFKIDNNCCSRLFPEFIQTQKRYPTSLDKMSILTQKWLAISSQNFSCWLNSLQNISYRSLRF